MSAHVRFSQKRGLSLPAAIVQSCHNNTRSKSCAAQETRLENSHDSQTLRIRKNVRRDDLVRPEGLSWVDEGGQRPAGLLALACSIKISNLLEEVILHGA